MRIKYLIFIFVLFASSLCLLEIFANQLPANENSLADLYKKGRLHLIPELIIDDSTLPKDSILEIPVEITCDSEGNLYVLDQKANNIKIFDSSGQFVKAIGRRGRGPGELNSPHHFTFAKDRLVV